MFSTGGAGYIASPHEYSGALTTADAALIVALVNAAPALEALVRAAEGVAHERATVLQEPAHDRLRAALDELDKVLG